MGPKPVTGLLLRGNREKFETQMHREKGHVDMRAEIGMKQP